jgi:endonuclease G, mitochondrial
VISPELLITNAHVLANTDAATRALVQFDFEEDAGGQELPITEFELQPERFFLVRDKTGLDYCVVAVGKRVGGEKELSDFQPNPLSNANDKHAEGDFVNIIQHPDGDRKQVVLRENRVVGRGKKGLTLHYGADTLPGASGSPVFNDDFEVIGLHHAGEPVLDTTLEENTPVPDSNEAIRASVIYDDLTSRLTELDANQRAMLKRALGASSKPAAMENARPIITAKPLLVPETVMAAEDAIRRVFHVPIEVSLRIGSLGGNMPVQPTINEPDYALERRNETPSGDFSDRKGYQEDFLVGSSRRQSKLLVPLPTLTVKLKGLASEVLPYHNFSLRMNTARKLAFFTAVNIDGGERRLESLFVEPAFEGSEKWFEDARADGAHFVQAFYSATSKMFDRGHLVRRLDPAWGELAELANDDTFHFTNCAPQHWQFNQGKSMWAGIEDYALLNARSEGERITVFSGPIFTNSDPTVGMIKNKMFASKELTIRDVQIPKTFFKIVVRVVNEDLRATGFIASQEALLKSGPLRGQGKKLEGFNELGNAKTYARSIKEIEKLTGLDFGVLRDKDSIQLGLESANRLGSLEEVSW